jgi:hypothetical protein
MVDKVLKKERVFINDIFLWLEFIVNIVKKIKNIKESHPHAL